MISAMMIYREAVNMTLIQLLNDFRWLSRIRAKNNAQARGSLTRASLLVACRGLLAVGCAGSPDAQRSLPDAHRDTVSDRWQGFWLGQ